MLDFFKKQVYNNIAIEKILEEWEQIPLFNYEKEKKLAKIEEKVESLIKQNIENLGYELYDVEYVKEAKDYISGAIGAMLNLGQGNGPLDHMWDL